MSASGGGLPLIVIEIFLGFGVPLAWGVWQLIELKKLARRDEHVAREAQGEAKAGDKPAADPDWPRDPPGGT